MALTLNIAYFRRISDGAVICDDTLGLQMAIGDCKMQFLFLAADEHRFKIGLLREFHELTRIKIQIPKSKLQRNSNLQSSICCPAHCPQLRWRDLAVGQQETGAPDDFTRKAYTYTSTNFRSEF